MIEKLEVEHIIIQGNSMPNNAMLMNKINEIIDVVNKITEKKEGKLEELRENVFSEIADKHSSDKD